MDWRKRLIAAGTGLTLACPTAAFGQCLEFGRCPDARPEIFKTIPYLSKLFQNAPDAAAAPCETGSCARATVAIARVPAAAVAEAASSAPTLDVLPSPVPAPAASAPWTPAPATAPTVWPAPVVSAPAAGSPATVKVEIPLEAYLKLVAEAARLEGREEARKEYEAKMEEWRKEKLELIDELAEMRLEATQALMEAQYEARTAELEAEEEKLDAEQKRVEDLEKRLKAVEEENSTLKRQMGFPIGPPAGILPGSGATTMRPELEPSRTGPTTVRTY